MERLNLLGFDFGASSGRAMLGEFDGEKIAITEIHRFSNDPVMLGDQFVWDIPRLFYNMTEALNIAAKNGIRLDGIGIDTWGVDFGLLDKNGALVSVPVHYRDARTNGVMEQAFKTVSQEEIFAETGLAFLQFNTLYQLLAMKFSGDPALSIADKLLFIPDLLAYFLTGKMGTEYTIASTSQMIDPMKRGWATGLLEKFGLPTHILTDVEQPGVIRGLLRADIANQAGMPQVPVIAVASHDTAAAVAAVPALQEDFAYISSGTWSLLGAEIQEPLCTPEVMRANYTNEGGVNGSTRLLKNIMGLWMIQECKREWDRREDAVDFAGLVKLAEKAEPFIALLDVDDARFMAPGDMPQRIQAYCQETGQRVPKGRGEISRVIYESLALKYRWAIERLEQDMLKKTVKALHIVGGGSKNEMLNQFTADALMRPVHAGPSEGTVIGNLLMQAMALGKIESMTELRTVVNNSFPMKTYLPTGGQAAWDAAYTRLLELLARKEKA